MHIHLNKKMARARSLVDSLVFVMMLATITTRVAIAGSPCDTAECGKGNCTVVPVIVPSIKGFECKCDPGWSRLYDGFKFLPCIIPNCTFDRACFNMTPSAPPKDIPNTNSCTWANCGPGGTCKEGSGFLNYRCECEQGFTKLINMTIFPCIRKCFLGMDCAALGLSPSPSPPPPPPPSSSGAPGPSGSSGSSNQKGNAALLGFRSRHMLMHLLALVSLFMVQAI